MQPHSTDGLNYCGAIENLKLSEAYFTFFLDFRKEFHNHLGISKNITVSASGGKWFASIQTEREIEKPMHPSTRIEGIDVGITRFATLSDGRYIKPLNTFRKHEKRLVKYQRCMSHIKQHSSKQFSNNWKKARVQKIHTDTANVRKDFLHKTTTTIRNMSRSAVLTKATQGRLNATPERSRNPRSL